MKTKKLTFLICLLIVGILIISSCSKDRLQSTVQLSNNDSFYTNNAPPEQSFQIDSLGGDTIRGMNGTKIWGVPKTIFMDKISQQNIYYPYTLNLIEAYTIKDMIMSKLPNVAQSNVLQASNEIKVTVFKNSNELALKQNCGYYIKTPSSAINNYMKVYYGFTNSTINDWNDNILQTDYLFSTDLVTKIHSYSSYFQMQIAKLGWLSVSGNVGYFGSTNINFTINGLYSDNSLIDVYIIFKNQNSYVKVSNLKAANMPVGELITAIAIAKQSSGTMLFFRKDYTISNGLTIPITLQSTTEANVLGVLSSF